MKTKLFYNLRKLNSRGQGMVEYALILSLVVVIAGAILNFAGISEAVEAIFDTVVDVLAIE